jgi:hypothetical protein
MMNEVDSIFHSAKEAVKMFFGFVIFFFVVMIGLVLIAKFFDLPDMVKYIIITGICLLPVGWWFDKYWWQNTKTYQRLIQKK